MGIGIALCLIIAAVLVLGGFVVGMWASRKDVAASNAALEVVQRDLRASRLENIALIHEADGWRQSSTKWRNVYLELLGKREAAAAATSKALDAAVQDPPTVGEADRAAMAARRKSQDRTDMRPIGVMDKDVAPVPQLRDADDDH